MAKNLWKIEPRGAPEPGASAGAGVAASSPSPAPQSVGVILRERREERGEDLRYVAQMLRIRYPYLRAIEEGLIDDLPGSTYAIGFVRTYAEHLDLDAADMVVRFKAEVQGLGSRNDLNFPAPIPEGKIPSGAILLVGIIVAALIYAVWIYVSSGDSVVSQSAPPPAAASVASAPAPEAAASQSVAPVTVSKPAESAASTEAGEPTPEEAKVPSASPPTNTVEAAPAGTGTPFAVKPDATETAKPVKAETAETAETAAPPAPPLKTDVASTPPAAAESAINAVEAAGRESKAYGNPDARIVLHAVADSWVEIRDKATDEILFTRVLFKGDSYRVPNRDGLSLLTGNAGGLRITVDGKEVAPIGRVGSVRRDFALEPKALAGN